MANPVVLTPEAYRKLKRLHDDYYRERGGGGTGTAQGTFNHGEYQFRNRVRFLNNAAETAPRYGVMRITGASSNQYVTIAKPSITFSRIYLINVDADVGSGKFGWGAYLTESADFFNAGYVLYDTASTPAYGESWGPQDGTWTLKKYRYGFTIIGGNAGTGATSRTMAIQQPVNVVYGQTNGAINKASTTGTVDLYDGNNAAISSTSLTSIVHNRFADVATSKKVICTWIGGNWQLTSAEC